MADVEIRLLGAFTVLLDGRPVVRWEHRRAADLVALLALAPGRTLPRDQVVEALWPDLPPGAGAANLHKAAHHARRALGADAVVLRAGVVTLYPGAVVRTDVDRFTDAARLALDLGDRAVCAAAADLHPAELLTDRIYDDWTVAHRDRLRRRRLELLHRAGRWRDVVAEDPTDEAAHRALMSEYLCEGNRHAAVRQFQRLRAILARDLGVHPTAETVALHRAAVAGLARSAGGPVTPLIGREVALARLHAALRSPHRRGALLLTGEAGIGKTRLCAEFGDQAERAGHTVVRVAAGQASALPFEVVRLLLRAGGRTDEGAATSGARQRLLALLEGMCRTGNTLFVVDDAHLADDDSVALLDLVVRGPAGCTVLLAMRPEPIGDALAAVRLRPDTTQVALPPLPREESDELVTAIVGRRPAGELLDGAWQLGAGNPFFTTELATAAVRGDAGGIPPTLTAAVSAGLAGCDPDLVELLRRVAVVGETGETVDADELTALAGLAEDAAFAALDRALAAGVLVVDGEGYRFRHALVARSLAESVPPHRRQAIHRATADALADRGGPPGRVARRLDAGGRPKEAVRWHVAAARAAGAVSAYADALGHVDAALATTPRDPELLALRGEYSFARGDPGAAAAYGEAAALAGGIRRDELRVRQAWVLLMSGDVAGAGEAIDGVVPAATTRMRLTLIGGLVAWFAGAVAEAERAARESMRLALAAGDTTDVLDSALLHALVAHSRGRWAEQLRLDLFDPRFAGALSGMLSDAHLCVGELYLFSGTPYGEIIDFATRLRATADAAGAARGRAFASTLLGEAQLLAGDLGGAEEHLLDGARAHRALGAHGGEAIALHALAELALVGDRRDAVAPLLDQALEAARFSPLSARHLLTRIYGTRIRSAPDDTAALAVLDEAQANLVRPAEACPLCWVPYLVPAATVLARTGRPDAAESLLATADELVGLLFSGRGGWAAAVTEARAVLAGARGESDRAAELQAAAAEGFARAGQPLQAARCRAAHVPS